jgi:hypothetical protein
MKEVITIQVGQTGNQVGLRWWDLLQQEHSLRGLEGSSTFRLDENESAALGTFFRPAEGSRPSVGDLQSGGSSFVERYRARAVLIDMEENVISQLARSPIGPLFDQRLRLTDVSGAGNNWAVGYAEYGPRYRDSVVELVRRSLEPCDSPQAFIMLHSLGGGTGSGFGSFILEQLEDNFPELYRFTSSLLPSRNDDVITSPYNALMSTARLVDHADAVLPIDNECLLELVAAVKKQQKGQNGLNSSSRATVGGIGQGYSLTSLRLDPFSSPTRERKEKESNNNGTNNLSMPERPSTAPSPPVAPAQPPLSPALLSVLQEADTLLDAINEKTSSISLNNKEIHDLRKEKAPTLFSARGGAKSARVTSSRVGLGGGDGDSRMPQKREGTSSSSISRTSGKESVSSISNKSTSRVSRAGISVGTAVSASRRPGGMVGPKSQSKGSGAVAAVLKPNNNASSMSLQRTIGSAVIPPKSSQGDSDTHRDKNPLESSSSSASSSSSRSPGSAFNNNINPIGSSNDDEEQFRSGSGVTQGGDDDEGLASEMGNGFKKRNGTAFDGMNNLVAHMLSNLTASMRFPGQLNVDINELTTTLVPFPRLHFFSTSIAPLVGAGLPPRQNADLRMCERIVAQGFSNTGLLVRSDVRRGVHLAAGVLLRGPFAVSDVNASVLKQQRELNMVSWNPDGFKIGMCSTSSLYSSVTALTVSNNCTISEPLVEGYSRFVKLYRARAHLHHFLEYIEADQIAAAAETVTGLIADYRQAGGVQEGV